MSNASPRAPTSPLLTVRGVKTFYGRVMALKGVDLDINEGEIVTLIGANGAGKSTLMMTICGESARPRRQHRIRRPGHHADADARDRAAAGWRSRRKAAASSRA